MNLCMAVIPFVFLLLLVSLLLFLWSPELVFGNGYGIGSDKYPIYDPWVCVHDGRSRIGIDNCIALGTDCLLI